MRVYHYGFFFYVSNFILQLTSVFSVIKSFLSIGVLGAAPLKVRQLPLSDVELVAQVPCSLWYRTVLHPAAAGQTPTVHTRFSSCQSAKMTLCLLLCHSGTLFSGFSCVCAKSRGFGSTKQVIQILQYIAAIFFFLLFGQFCVYRLNSRNGWGNACTADLFP